MQKIFSRDMWGMFAGDADATGNIDMTDKTAVWNLQAGTKGYLGGDLNMNVEVDNKDKNDYWYQNMGEESQVSESGGSRFNVPSSRFCRKDETTRKQVQGFRGWKP